MMKNHSNLFTQFSTHLLVTSVAALALFAGLKANAQDESTPATEKVETVTEEVVVAEVPETSIEASSSESGTLLPPSVRVQLEKTSEQINGFMEPIARWSGSIFFVGVDAMDGSGETIPDRKGEPVKIWYVVVWLALAGLILTLSFGFLNIRGLPLAWSTLRGKYSSPSDPGEITHFQALSSALSGTVGLGNIAGVAIAISVGGPGAIFWMVVAGFLGMTTKFCECTLGVKYRRVKPNGKVLGGPMYYLADGFKARNMAGLGKILAILFGIFCAIAAIGAGNLFQVNQALEQLVVVTNGEGGSYFASDDGKMVFGIVMALIVGLVVVFGIKGIGKVTSFLVPLMCGIYVIGCLAVLGMNAGKIPEAIQTIWNEAFTPAAGVGGILIAILMGFRRAAFSNEAGFGSAAIAHSAVRTKHPASEGLVALLEPFVDTVIVCTMTGLAIVVTGAWETGLEDAAINQDLSKWGKGIALTSMAFTSTLGDWSAYILAIAAVTFALSTLVTWCYYGEQGFSYIFGGNAFMGFVYRLIFVLFIVVGAVISLGSVVDFADGPFFALCVINLLGVYCLLPDVREELKSYREHVRSVKNGVPGDPSDPTEPNPSAVGETITLGAPVPRGQEDDVVDLATKYGSGSSDENGKGL